MKKKNDTEIWRKRQRRRNRKRKTDKYRMKSKLKRTRPGKDQFGKQKWEGQKKLAINEEKDMGARSFKKKKKK